MAKKSSPKGPVVAADATIDVLLSEKRQFAPPRAFAQKANVRSAAIYKKAERNPEKFWADYARELTWYKPWKKVLDWKPPKAKWFVGGKAQRLGQLPRPAPGRPRGATRPRSSGRASPATGAPSRTASSTSRSSKFANVLKTLGVRRGDRVTIYMPMVPEAAIAMLACARIGAIHSVVFGGFSAEALGDRINDRGAKLVITADGGWRRGHVVPLKENVDEALKDAPTVENVVLVMRAHHAIDVKDGRDVWWHEAHGGGSGKCEPEAMDSETSAVHPLHVGHHRQAEGHRAHDGRLPDAACDDEDGFRSEGRRRLLVHRRHRLGHRPQLRRLRPARERRDGA